MIDSNQGDSSEFYSRGHGPITNINLSNSETSMIITNQDVIVVVLLRVRRVRIAA